MEAGGIRVLCACTHPSLASLETQCYGCYGAPFPSHLALPSMMLYDATWCARPSRYQPAMLSTGAMPTRTRKLERCDYRSEWSLGLPDEGPDELLELRRPTLRLRVQAEAVVDATDGQSTENEEADEYATALPCNFGANRWK